MQTPVERIPTLVKHGHKIPEVSASGPPIIGSLTKHDQPLRLLNTVAIGLGITKRLPLGALGLLDLVAGTVTDEDGLASPLDDDLRRIRKLTAMMNSAILTFLPSGIDSRSISTLAWARTSAEADMLTRKSDEGQISH